MAIKIQSTADFGTDGIKTVIYGASGVGKTRLARTASNCIILSAEKGLLSLNNEDIPYIEISRPKDVDDAYAFLKSDTEYQTVFLDTISEIGEVLLTDFLLHGHDGAAVKDGRQAYRMLADAMMPMIRNYRDLPGKNIVFLAKMEVKDDEDGITNYRPMIPGQVIKNQLPYMFDGLWNMDIQKVNKEDVGVLQTTATRGRYCKDRSGNLDQFERPDIDAIFAKAKGT